MPEVNDGRDWFLESCELIDIRLERCGSDCCGTVVELWGYGVDGEPDENGLGGPSGASGLGRETRVEEEGCDGAA